MAITNEEMFEKLVLNAFDFMERAHNQIETDPKMSIIFFWTSLELFVKARLMKEHWSLILTRPEKADIEKFRKGDFHSVSFEKAIDRLKNVCGPKMRGADSGCFTTLKEHRNRLVHFFSTDYSDSDKEPLVRQAAIEQCLAWYYLHSWLTVDWSDEFAGFQKRIMDVHGLIRTNRKFLQAKYDEVLPSIKMQQSQGKVFGDCVACGFKSALEEELIKQSDLALLTQKCLVCDYITSPLRIQCPNCSESIDIEEMGEGTCAKCEFEMDLDYLLANYGEHGSPADEEIRSSNAYCSFCEHSWKQTVIELKDGSYLCLNCLDTSNQVSQCECCSEQVSGVPENTLYNGCVVCTGRFTLG